MIFICNKLFLFTIRVLKKIRIDNYIKIKLPNCRLILEKTHKEKTDFYFIQIGANDGISFDFLYDFLIKRNSKGLAIEPIKEYYEELVKNYKDYPQILKINKAVHPNKKSLEIYKIDKNKANKYPDWVKGIASIDKNHHKKTKIASDDIIVDVVQADTLMNIIKSNYTYNSIDFIQIDTEGFDFEVVKMIDFEVLKPDIIKYESVNLKKEDQHKLRLLLGKQGYFLFNEIGDTIGINLKKIKLF